MKKDAEQVEAQTFVGEQVRGLQFILSHLYGEIAQKLERPTKLFDVKRLQSALAGMDAIVEPASKGRKLRLALLEMEERVRQFVKAELALWDELIGEDTDFHDKVDQIMLEKGSDEDQAWFDCVLLCMGILIFMEDMVHTKGLGMVKQESYQGGLDLHQMREKSHRLLEGYGPLVNFLESRIRSHRLIRGQMRLLEAYDGLINEKVYSDRDMFHKVVAAILEHANTFQETCGKRGFLEAYLSNPLDYQTTYARLMQERKEQDEGTWDGDYEGLDEDWKKGTLEGMSDEEFKVYINHRHKEESDFFLLLFVIEFTMQYVTTYWGLEEDRKMREQARMEGGTAALRSMQEIQSAVAAITTKQEADIGAVLHPDTCRDQEVGLCVDVQPVQNLHLVDMKQAMKPYQGVITLNGKASNQPRRKLLGIDPEDDRARRVGALVPLSHRSMMARSLEGLDRILGTYEEMMVQMGLGDEIDPKHADTEMAEDMINYALHRIATLDCSMKREDANELVTRVTDGVLSVVEELSYRILDGDGDKKRMTAYMDQLKGGVEAFAFANRWGTQADYPPPAEVQPFMEEKEFYSVPELAEWVKATEHEVFRPVFQVPHYSDIFLNFMNEALLLEVEALEEGTSCLDDDTIPRLIDHVKGAYESFQHLLADIARGNSLELIDEGLRPLHKLMFEIDVSIRQLQLSYSLTKEFTHYLHRVNHRLRDMIFLYEEGMKCLLDYEQSIEH